MINIIFSAIEENRTSDLIDRFNSDYPNSVSEYHSEESELVFKNVADKVEDVDTFLCEEICHEFEVCCYIQDVENKTSKNYYYDEEDEWIYK
jgi:hypothetical protein